MLTCNIKRGNEEFEVSVSEDSKNATVTDELSTKVTISFDSGNLSVRLPNGWGGWTSSMPAAVDYAVNLCRESRGQITRDSAFQEMVDYVKNCKDDKDDGD